MKKKWKTWLLAGFLTGVALLFMNTGNARAAPITGSEAIAIGAISTVPPGDVGLNVATALMFSTFIRTGSATGDYTADTTTSFVFPDTLTFGSNVFTISNAGWGVFTSTTLNSDVIAFRATEASLGQKRTRARSRLAPTNWLGLR